MRYKVKGQTRTEGIAVSPESERAHGGLVERMLLATQCCLTEVGKRHVCTGVPRADRAGLSLEPLGPRFPPASAHIHIPLCF